MDLSELNQIDPQTIGSAPLPIRIGVIVIICAIVGFLGYNQLIKGKLENLARVEKQEPQLKKKFESKQRQAANLEGYKKQLAEMETTFGSLLRQLPGKTEVEGLIDDINRSAIGSGLEVTLFKPQREVQLDFYAELPMSIKAKAEFHEVANFISDVAGLDRIVTIHNVSLTRASSGQLTFDAVAKTYRYLGE